ISASSTSSECTHETRMECCRQTPSAARVTALVEGWFTEGIRKLSRCIYRGGPPDRRIQRKTLQGLRTGDTISRPSRTSTQTTDECWRCRRSSKPKTDGAGGRQSSAQDGGTFSGCTRADEPRNPHFQVASRRCTRTRDGAVSAITEHTQEA